MVLEPKYIKLVCDLTNSVIERVGSRFLLHIYKHYPYYLLILSRYCIYSRFLIYFYSLLIDCSYLDHVLKFPEKRGDECYACICLERELRRLSIKDMSWSMHFKGKKRIMAEILMNYNNQYQ